MSWLERMDNWGLGAPKCQDWFQHHRQTSILPRLLHVITQERKIAVSKWGFSFQTGIHSASLLRAISSDTVTR